jgi:hypothetical protein
VRSSRIDSRKFDPPIPGGESGVMGETVYSSTYQPNPRSALDVLAFVLTPVEAFTSHPDEIDAVAELLDAAKSEAIERWQSLRAQGLDN